MCGEFLSFYTKIYVVVIKIVAWELSGLNQDNWMVNVAHLNF